MYIALYQDPKSELGLRFKGLFGELISGDGDGKMLIVFVCKE